jgi:adenylate kinase
MSLRPVASCLAKSARAVGVRPAFVGGLSTFSTAAKAPEPASSARKPPHRSHIGVNLADIEANVHDPTVTHAAIVEGGSTLPDFAAQGQVLNQLQAEMGANKILSELNVGGTVEAEAKKLEIEDPKLIFDSAWRALVAKYGIERLSFPSVIIYLSGAPGAGKGTISSELLKQRDLPPTAIFEVSSLLSTPAMKAKKDAGVLIGDKEVVLAVLEELLKERYRNGAVVDGYPRTRIQAECIKLLHDKLTDLFNTSKSNPALRNVFKRPKISIACLYVDESESIRRQMKRGKELLAFNKMVAEVGVGKAVPVRATDVSEEAAKKRYLVFKEEIFSSLQAIKDKFPFHFIDAGADLETVVSRVQSEFSYQSSQDLDDEAFEKIRKIDSAKEIIRSAR